MSIKTTTIYWVECDFPGCNFKSTEGSDYVGLVELDQALAELDEIDWITVLNPTGFDTHYCGAHWHWCDRCEDVRVPSTGNAPRYCPACKTELENASC
jgi:hypothetical protein